MASCFGVLLASADLDELMWSPITCWGGWQLLLWRLFLLATPFSFLLMGANKTGIERTGFYITGDDLGEIPPASLVDSGLLSILLVYQAKCSWQCTTHASCS